MSKLLSDVLEATSHADGQSQESISTEDFLSEVDSKLEEIGLEGLVEGELFVGSLGVQGLFPALDIPTVTRICARRWRSSGLRILGANYFWATIYLALTLSERELEARGVKLQEGEEAWDNGHRDR